MVKINNQSKRVPCKRRYRIAKRIRDHNKKTRKEGKKSGNNIKKKLKSIIVPGKCPFKDDVLALAEKQKQSDLDAKKKVKEEKKKNKVAKKLQEKQAGSLSKSLEHIMKQAQKKQEQFEKKANFINKTNPFDETYRRTKGFTEKESSLKTFYKEFKKVLDASDVLIEVLDARDPLGSRCPQVEDMIINSGRNKHLVLLLNKIDLVPKQNAQAWLKYLRGQYPTVAFKSSTQGQKDKLSQSSVPIDKATQNLLTSSQCLGADILVKLLNSFTRLNDIKQTITVGIIGLPNVGKSSVINSLKRTHACQIGSMPGLTRCMQEIKLDKHIKLLDCPGIVMSRDEDCASLALKNCIRIESINDPSAPVELLLKRCNKEQLIVCYKISDFKDATDFLTQLAKRCGKVKKNGIPDIKKAAQLVLNDWTGGKLTFYTQPPSLEKAIETKIITNFSKGFDIESLFKEENEIIESIDDTKLIVDGIEMTSNEPVKINFEELEQADQFQESSEDDENKSLEEEEMHLILENEDEDEEEMKENETDKKSKTFKSDVVLNPKQSKKLKAAEQQAALKENQTTDRSSLKKKAREKSDPEEDIYKQEDIPRTKKLHKIEKKKQFKKEKRTDKLFNNLGEMLNSVKIFTKQSDMHIPSNKFAVKN